MPAFRSYPVLVLVLLAVAPVYAAEGEYPPLKLDAAHPPKERLGLPLVFREEFEEPHAKQHWQPTDPAAWKVVAQGDNHVFALTKKQSDYKPPVRSPFNLALVKDLTLSDCVLDVRLQSTEKDYAHRSLCLFFGYQDNAHLYYVHFGKKTDDHANQIFIVNDAPRAKISTRTTPGTDWDDNWHHARVVRRVESGEIQVYFDDMQTPVMTAVDRTFTWGQVGIGSFDDRGQFDHVLVYGTRAEPKK